MNQTCAADQNRRPQRSTSDDGGTYRKYDSTYIHYSNTRSFGIKFVGINPILSDGITPGLRIKIIVFPFLPFTAITVEKLCIVFLQLHLVAYVATDESLRAAVASPVYWLIVVVATVASYVGLSARPADGTSVTPVTYLLEVVYTCARGVRRESDLFETPRLGRGRDCDNGVGERLLDGCRLAGVPD